MIDNDGSVQAEFYNGEEKAKLVSLLSSTLALLSALLFFSLKEALRTRKKVRAERGRRSFRLGRINPRFESALKKVTMAARNLAALRSEMESALTGRVAAPFTYRDRKLVETVSSGAPEIDLLTGGLPRGSLTEICGPICSGRASLLISALASRTADAEACAFIDGRDAFDPHSAASAGVELKQLLWVRCRNIEQALRATDLLLQSGGFGMVVLDLGDIPAKTVRDVPLNVWFRFRRAVEDTATIFLVVEQEPHAKTCASLVLRMEAAKTWWSRTGSVREECIDAHGRLFDGTAIRAEVVRSRVKTAGAEFEKSFVFNATNEDTASFSGGRGFESV